MSSEELQTKKRDMRQESLHLRLQQQSGRYLEQVWVDEALDKLNHPPK